MRYYIQNDIYTYTNTYISINTTTKHVQKYDPSLFNTQKPSHSIWGSASNHLNATISIVFPALLIQKLIELSTQCCAGTKSHASTAKSTTMLGAIFFITRMGVVSHVNDHKIEERKNLKRRLKRRRYYNYYKGRWTLSRTHMKMLKMFKSLKQIIRFKSWVCKLETNSQNNYMLVIN